MQERSVIVIAVITRIAVVISDKALITTFYMQINDLATGMASGQFSYR